MTGQKTDTLLIFGVTPRSGTNYLYELLRLHPDVGGCGAIVEDYLTHHAAPLATFSQQLAAHWRMLGESWPGELSPRAEDELLAALGSGLLGYLRRDCTEPVAISKTPSPANLDLAPRLFPDARLLALVRDGRAVVESCVRTRLGPQHGNRYDVFATQWAAGVRTILDYRAACGESERVHLVYYEDLVREPETTLRRLLPACGLDTARYDFAAAVELPVWGSSTFGQTQPQGDGETHARPGAHLDWQPKPKTADFDPLARFAGWPADRHRLFNAIAGEAMRALGYELIDPDERSPEETGDV